MPWELHRPPDNQQGRPDPKAGVPTRRRQGISYRLVPRTGPETANRFRPAGLRGAGGGRGGGVLWDKLLYFRSLWVPSLALLGYWDMGKGP